MTKGSQFFALCAAGTGSSSYLLAALHDLMLHCVASLSGIEVGF